MKTPPKAIQESQTPSMKRRAQNNSKINDFKYEESLNLSTEKELERVMKEGWGL
jgi:hypothetical protein